MTATVTVTNPPEPAQLPPLPGPENVDLRHIPITPRRPRRRTYPTGNIHKQRRPKGNQYR